MNVKVEAHIKVGAEVVWAGTYNSDIMKMGQRVRSPLIRRFNAILKEAKQDEIVYMEYWGQIKFPPYTTYSGNITGLNGRVMRREGGLET